MNQLNHASLGASQRLVAAGIVLETEQKWRIADDGTACLVNSKDYEGTVWFSFKLIPAPSMAEVWRELPENTKLLKGVMDGTDWTVASTTNYGTAVYENPCDALADLLIWVKGRGEK
jgi:hypothetical protein